MPWAGFFRKMQLCEELVLLDVVPFSKNSFQNRTKIKTQQGEQWLTVPVLTKGRFSQRTNEACIAPNTRWASKHWSAIEQAYSKAPFFAFVREHLKPVFEQDWEILTNLTTELIARLAAMLEIPTRITLASQLASQGQRSELLRNLAVERQASIYLSGPSGNDYLDLSHFRQAGVEVKFFQFAKVEYPQLHGPFCVGLSVLDLLANCGPESGRILERMGRVAEPVENPASLEEKTSLSTP